MSEQSPKRAALERAQAIANAVLYEGYILYPYRPSAVKNQQRWTFGGVYPPAYSLAQQGTDPCHMQTECLVQGPMESLLDLRVRFLQIQDRVVGELEPPLADLPPGVEPDFRPVQTLQVGDRAFHAWQEAVEREIVMEGLRLSDLLARPQQRLFAFPDQQQLEVVRDPTGPIVGVIAHRQQAIIGAVEVMAAAVGSGLFKVTVRIHNLTNWDPDEMGAADAVPRQAAVMRAFISTHTLLALQNAEFISLLEPPEAVSQLARECHNLGTWPVLVGEAGERDLMLSSPIILYDYPQIAPESAGDLFDGTEIDEILTLRILTLTEEEKREVREADDRARALLDRTEALPPELLARLHGAVRNLKPAAGDEAGQP